MISVSLLVPYVQILLDGCILEQLFLETGMMMARNILRFISLTVTILSIGCGKYGPPVSPEATAPSPTLALDVKGGIEGIKINWKAPDTDNLGRELKTIDGYHVYRKELIDPLGTDILDPKEYKLVASVVDTHLLELKKLRDEAKEKNLPTRKVKVADEAKQFTFTDNVVSSGKIYLYKIIPFNQNGVDGEPGQIVRVFFRGESSQVNFIPLEKKSYNG